ncbi:hypothetical protein SLA2020_065030 [Shorea laevis]
MERANAHGQTSDDFGNTEQSFDLFEYTMHAQNNEDSNAVMGQQALSLPQATLVASTSMDISQSKAAKRARDQAYRERLKKRRIETEVKMDTLTEENKVLKRENTALKAENTLQKQALLSRETEMEKFKHEHNKARHEFKKQNALAQAVSDILAHSDLHLREENQKLQNENYLLRQMLCMDNPMSQLVEEVGKLRHDKKVMKVQLDAVCEKLIREKIG